MTTLKISALSISLFISFVVFSATAYGQTKHVNSPKACTIHVLTQGGSPNATTVLVCG
jgi:hypothetical protein